MASGMTVQKTETKQAPDERDLLQAAKDNFKWASEAEAEQRDREEEDLRFQVAEFQWDEDARTQRRGDRIADRTIPARPMLSVSLLKQPIRLILNQATSAHLGVNIHPVSEKSSKEVAQKIQDLYRRIERDCNANQARLWALDRAVQVGRGWYRVGTKWDEDSDHPFDQEITIERIYDQAQVFADPASQKQDFSDARWIIVAVWYTVDRFRREFPGKEIPQSETIWQTWADEDPLWVQMGAQEDDNPRRPGSGRAVLVAEYWYKDTVRVEVDIKGAKRELGPDEPWMPTEGKRIMEDHTIRMAKLSSREVLTREEWAGKYFPFVPTIGNELQPFDEDHRWEGLIRPARDGQRFYNYACSSLVERMALEPKSPFIGTKEQFRNYEQWWEQANTRNFPYLPYNAHVTEGGVIPRPERQQLDTTGMAISSQAMTEARNMVQETHGYNEAALSQIPENPTAQSGRAMLAAQQQSDAGSAQYLQNMANISMMYEARVVIDLIPRIYDRAGRVTQVLGEDNKSEMVMLNAPYQLNDDGVPVGADPNLPTSKLYELAGGRYAISVDVGRPYQTRLQEGQSEIGQLIEANPALAPVLTPDFLEFKDFPGAQRIAEAMRKIRDQQYPGLFDDNEDGLTPDQLRQQVQAVGQELEQTKQQLQGAIQQIELDTAKQQAMLQKAMMDNESDERIQAMKSQTELLIANTKAEMQHFSDEMTARLKVMLEEMSGVRDSELQAQKGETDVTVAAINTIDSRGGTVEVDLDE